MLDVLADMIYQTNQNDSVYIIGKVDRAPIISGWW